MEFKRKSRRRPYDIRVRLTDSEYKILLKEKQEEILPRNTLSEYVRYKLFKGQNDIVGLQLDFKELVYQIRKIGVNVNQIAARKNVGMQFKEDDQELLVKMDKINQLLSDIEKQLEGLYGNH